MLEDPRVIRVLAYQRSSLLAAGGTFGPSLLASRGDPVRPTGPVVGLPIRPRRLHAPSHPGGESGGEILLRADGVPASATRWPRVPADERDDPSSASRTPIVSFLPAAPASPERHCRERRGPPACGGLGSRGAIRARLPCRDREHGGTQAASRRTGSARKAWSEGLKARLLLSRRLTSFQRHG
jgi:hypothetical protein